MEWVVRYPATARRPARPPQRRRTITTATISPGLVQRIQTIFSGTSDFPCKGVVRFLNTCRDHTQPVWLLNEIYVYDRTITEWRKLIDTYKSASAVSEPVDSNNPFLYRSAAGIYLENLYFKQMRLRSLVRKWIANVRCRLMRRRRIGEIDLYTTELIPESSRVYVYDYASKSQYVFHTQTILKTVVNALTYSSYGIAAPMIPKNPYTNITWTYAQQMVIMSQIQVNLLGYHRMLPPYVYAYRECCYDIDTFLRKNHMKLEFDASAYFFTNSLSDPYARSIYMEMVDDLHMESALHLSRGLRQSIEDHGTLPNEIESRWNDIVIRAWICENYRYIDNNLRDEFLVLHRDTLEWHMTLSRSRHLGALAMGGR